MEPIIKKPSKYENKARVDNMNTYQHVKLIENGGGGGESK